MLTLQDLKRESRWLSRHAADVTSQAGEDGIIEKALSLLPSRSHCCVEFGAWDGKHFSNTYALMAREPQCRVVLIEPDQAKFRDLTRQYAFRDRATCLNAFVGFDATTSLDVLLKGTEIPIDFDLLSIDIDGNDYHVWAATTTYRARLVVIEYNPTMSNASTYVQRAAPDCSHGSAPRPLVDLGRRKGYELIAATPFNLMFVRAEDFGYFQIPDNSLDVMRDDDHVPQLAVAFDGQVLVDHQGHDGVRLLWHRTLIHSSKLQVIPRYLRTYPDNYTALQRWAFKAWRFTEPNRWRQRLRRTIPRA